MIYEYVMRVLLLIDDQNPSFHAISSSNPFSIARLTAVSQKQGNTFA